MDAVRKSNIEETGDDQHGLRQWLRQPATQEDRSTEKQLDSYLQKHRHLPLKDTFDL